VLAIVALIFGISMKMGSGEDFHNRRAWRKR